jgi:hypothetical protein
MRRKMDELGRELPRATGYFKLAYEEGGELQW